MNFLEIVSQKKKMNRVAISDISTIGFIQVLANIKNKYQQLIFKIMKQLYILTTFFILTFSQVNAQYFWQVESITSISDGGTYNQNDTPNDILLNIGQCRRILTTT